MSQEHCDITQAISTEITARLHKDIAVLSSLIAIH